jgi:hypothetical protein
LSDVNFVAYDLKNKTFSKIIILRATTEDIDYLENQCAELATKGMCDYQEYPGQDLGFADLQITARSKKEVKKMVNYCFVYVRNNKFRAGGTF